MTDREKQIEEMAKVLLETSCKGSECENCAFVKSVKEAKETCVCLKALYNAGYRKLPEGAVVLTKEEMKHPTRTEVIEFFVNHNAQVRKEMAREILNEIGNTPILDKGKYLKDLNESQQELLSAIGKNLNKKLKELAKKYGVDLEE